MNKDVLKEFLKKTGQTEFVKYLLFKTDYLTAPASATYHNNVEGGLVDHSMNVTRNLLALSEKLDIKWDRPESPYIIGMFHDLCKTNFYKISKRSRKNEETGQWEQYEYYVVEDKLPLGHGDKSCYICFMNGVQLTEQELFCIKYHMGAFGDSDYQRDYGNACRKYPEILVVAMADQLAGIQEVDPTLVSLFTRGEPDSKDLL